jgi:tyrosine-specific transport protein
MSKKRVFSAVATLVGSIIGAGILGLPHVIAKAGFLTGLVDILLIGFLFLLINLYLGEVTLRTKGTHQLAFYADKYLGHNGKRIMFISTIIGIYGALVAYIIGQGAAVASIFGINDFLGSALMFILLSFLVYVGLGAIEKAESFIVPLVLGITLIVSLFAFGKVEHSNLDKFDYTNLLVPYGVIFFAFIGTSSIPSIKEELEKDKKSLKKAIMIGSLIPIFVYILFVFAMVGVSGTDVSEIASLSFGDVLGKDFAFLGGIFAMLTMTTSFLALGIALKNIFGEDYGMSNNKSWFLACFVPFLIFSLLKLADLASFEYVLDLTGVITGVITAVLIILMAYFAKVEGNRKPEYSIFINKGVAIVLISLIVLGGLLKLLVFV